MIEKGEKKMNAFENLFAVNVNGYTEKKKTGGTELTYLSWPYAWAEVKKRYPDASYEIEKFGNGLPYIYDEKTGYMVYTTVTIEGVTHEMWLPVMDGANKAMKAEPYTYTTKYYGKEAEKTVAAATMFDINKTIMRCLVKNLAMFGLGLYIYAGEDLPITEENTSDKSEEKVEEKPSAYITDIEKMTLESMCKKRGLKAEKVFKGWPKLTGEQYLVAVGKLNEIPEKPVVEDFEEEMESA